MHKDKHRASVVIQGRAPLKRRGGIATGTHSGRARAAVTSAAAGKRTALRLAGIW